MLDLFWRSAHIVIQAAIGMAVGWSDLRQRLRTGRGAFILPPRTLKSVWLVDWLFWLTIVFWAVIGITWFFFPASRIRLFPLTPHVDFFLSLVGMTIALAGLVYIVGGVISLGLNFRTSIVFSSPPRLINTGFYRVLRNPMALGLMLEGWATALLHQTFVAVGMALLMHLANRLRVHFEERHLLSTLGADYADYCRETGRFVPRMRRARSGRTTSQD